MSFTRRERQGADEPNEPKAFLSSPERSTLNGQLTNFHLVSLLQPSVQPFLAAHGDSSSTQSPPNRHSPSCHRLAGHQTGAQRRQHQPLHARVRTMKRKNMFKIGYRSCYFPFFAKTYPHFSIIHTSLTVHLYCFGLAGSPLFLPRRRRTRSHISKSP